MINRGQNFRSVPLNVCGSSVFGRYPKISIERTYNMFLSDGWLVDYAGYQVAIPASQLGNARRGRGQHTSTKLNKIISVLGKNVYLIDLFFDQNTAHTFDTSVIKIGELQTSNGIVYITENNKPQIVISDLTTIYFYDPSLSPPFQVATEDGASTPINFTPGFIDYHDTYILCAASNDNTYAPPADNTWRLGIIDPNTGKLIFPQDAASVGLIETKPDNTKGVVRFPSKGNMIMVMGEIVSEPWFDTGAQLFPYQRNNQYNIDYGCLQPATIASLDEIVVWLAQNEKSGPIIVYSDGGMPKKITTDGIDYLFSQFTAPEDSRAFLYRQDGHLFYHINFYTDNISLFYDFNTNKFYDACDENLNYFIGHSVVFFNNQYYFLSQNDGNLYAFDTIFTTYNGKEIPRIRTCKSIRLDTQEYFIANDVGFTIEQGNTPYQQQGAAPINLVTQNGNQLVSQNGIEYISNNSGGFTQNILPRVDFSISINGGESFGSDFPYVLNPLGYRKNKLMWWQCGAANDFTPQFKFWGLGRFVAYDGVVNIRQ